MAEQAHILETHGVLIHVERIMLVQRAHLVPLLGLAFCVVLFPQENRSHTVSVDEAQIGFHFFPQTVVEVPIFNHASHMVRGTLVVEMLGNQNNAVVAQREKSFEAPPGAGKETLEWDQKDLPTLSLAFLSAYRLHYAVKPVAGTAFAPIEGIVQMGPHMVDGFGIQGYPSGEFACSRHCDFLVRVAEPNSGRALAGYDVKANFGPDPGTAVTATTDKDGYAAIHYDVAPRDLTYPGVGMQITATRGPFSTGWGGELFEKMPPHLTLTTDRPSYRPGETVHAHILLSGEDAKPWAGGNVSLIVTDPFGGQELLREKLVTSSSGEVDGDWKIPAEIKDGNLSILGKSEDEPQGNWTAQCKVKIQVKQEAESAFKVSAVLDRPYYLQGQEAVLTVIGVERAGTPVRQGKITVDAGQNMPPLQGDLSASGKFVAHIDLKKMWEWSKQGIGPMWPSPPYWEFPVAVSIEDGATGETESRSVSLRLARQEIHLNIFGSTMEGSEKTFAIVSSNVDRSPASVDGFVETAMPNADGKCPMDSHSASWSGRGSFHTNSYGVAQFTLPQSWIHYAYPEREDGFYSWYAQVHRPDAPNGQLTKNACIQLRAMDGKGKTGTLYEQVFIGRENHFSMRVSTDHALYRRGEPMHVAVESDAGLTEAVAEIRGPGQELVGAQHSRLTNGRADFTFPYAPQMKGLLAVYVFAVTGAGDPNPSDSWSREVIYVADEARKSGDMWPTDIWRPDQVWPDSSNEVKPFNAEEQERIAGIKKADLLKLDPAAPVPEGLDLVAWALLGPAQSWIGWSTGYYSFQTEAIDKLRLGPIEPALRKDYALTGKIPKSEKELVEVLKKAGIDFPSLRDGWGMPYHAHFAAQEIYLISNGPDKLLDTRDDYLAGKISWR